MSGTGGGSSKRLHEEAAHGHFSSAAKYPPPEVASRVSVAGPNTTFPNLPTTKPLSNTNEYHAGAAPFELSLDARLAKIPRTESRDAGRRSSSLIPMHGVPSLSSGDLHSDHPVAPENMVELRDSLKDGNRDLKMVENNRDVKAESREFHIEAKRYSADKGEKEAGRFESSRPGDDSNKEAKYDREVHTAALKCDVSAVSVHLNWKDSKEYNRGKRYPESSPSSEVGSMEPWHISQSTLYRPGPVEVGKEVATTEEREYVESNGREAVGENKVGFKGEDRFKDKDRKRKESKHRDWGEREKEKSDRRGNLHIGTSGSECRDSMREEREAERWEREKKDLLKERERSKEREKDHIHVKREAWNGVETGSLQHHEKGVMDDSTRKTEQQENLGIEQKKQKDFDCWKNADREARERRKERDAEAEGDKPERQSKIYEKESDNGCTDVDGGSEREREVFNYGVQQRKRMLRPRGSPQVANCFMSHTQDAEGSQGKPEISTVVYKVGECMQELIKLWRKHKSSQAEKNGESSHCGPTLEIRIPAEHVTATNRQVRGGQLWGTDIYTDDSDLVAVLMHTGYCRPTASPPPSAIQELRATIQVLPPQDCYVSTLRNNVRSRAWGAAIGCSYCVEHCCIVKKGGGTIELEPCLTHTSTVEPTLAPVAVERTMTTRAAASNALRQQRFVREVTIQYNLCNEPWIKYSISIVADKGLKKPLYTSARLKKGEVLYLETHSRRYELCFTGEKMVKAATAPQMHEVETEKSHNHNLHSSNGERNLVDGDNIVIDVFRWSRCKKPLPQKVMQSVGIPLPSEYLEVLEENLDWEDVQWSQTGVWIGGKEYALARVHFLSPN